MCILAILCASLVSQMVKRLPAMRETRVRSLGRENPWRRKWQPTPVLLPGKFHGQRSLVGYSPWNHKQSDMTELLSISMRMHEKIRQCVTESFMLGTGREVIEGVDRASVTFWIILF